MEKHIVLFGAGKSATVLINYLKKIACSKNWKVSIVDSQISVLEEKIGDEPNLQAIAMNIDQSEERKRLVKEANVVISLLPPNLHFLVAKDCLEFEKNLLTASYIDAQTRELASEIEEKKLLFLYEMGLDPGIDHMSAMKLIHQIQHEGGKITSFKSHCGGLVAPESDNNPWHYKISWNPKNVVLAGKAGALFQLEGKLTHVPYETIFLNCESLQIEGLGKLAYYPNRDSLAYMQLYGLENAADFIRTTLRHPDFCTGWESIIALDLTNELQFVDTNGLSISQFLQNQFNKKHHHFDEESHLFQNQLRFLGWDDTSILNQGTISNADVLVILLEKALKLASTDKDMIVMVHEIKYEINGISKLKTSKLVVIGTDAVNTAMAKTVGLPLGIAAVLILENKIQLKGLQIPIVPEIYEPVLAELAIEGIQFSES